MLNKKQNRLSRQKADQKANGNDNSLRIVGVGGFEEVGRNMTLIEYGGEMLVIDVGLQFPEEDMPGIDYIIPNPQYLRDNAKQIKGVVITHGHYDHIGATQHILPEIGNPVVYTGSLSRGIIMRRYEDYKDTPEPQIKQVKRGEKYTIGKNFEVEFIHINHNIPDSYMVYIKTPGGNVLHTGDYKFDRNPYKEDPADIARLAQIGQEEGVDVLLSDSTNADQEGFSISETEIKQNLEKTFEEFSDKRIIVGTFASLVTRVQQIFDIAEKHGRKVAVDGYSMKSILDISSELGYVKHHKNTRIPIKDVNQYPPEQVVVIGTGAQGEGNAVLMRIGQKEHKHVQLSNKDVVIFSSSIVPGNEQSIQDLKDLIYRQGAKVLDYKMLDIHAGGHAHREDMKMLINLTQPTCFIPIQANYYLERIHADLAKSMGVREENVLLMSNGQIAEYQNGHISIAEETIPSNYVFVDGLGVGDVGDIVMRDRQKMAEDGMFVVIVRIEGGTGKVQDNVDVISRGFVYMSESKNLIENSRTEAKKIAQKSAASHGSTNWSYMKDELRNQLGKFLFEKTGRRPLILPVVLEV